MTTITLFILAFTYFVSFASTGPETVPTIICNFLEVGQTVTHQMDANEIPGGCKAIYYGSYYFDSAPTADDNKQIASVVKKGLPVYTAVSGSGKPAPWVEMMTTNTHDKDIETMVTYMKDNKISGILLSVSKVVYDENVANITSNLAALIDKINTYCDSSLKIGIMINGKDYGMFGKEDRLNFTTINPMLDMFVIDTTPLVLNCDEKYSKDQYGLLPINHTNGGSLSLDVVFGSVAASTMDKNRTFVYFTIWVAWTVPTRPPQSNLEYPQYCESLRADPGDAIICADTTKMYSDRAKFAKSFNFKGLIFGQLDYDYWNDKCQVPKYSITNAFIGGWES